MIHYESGSSLYGAGMSASHPAAAKFWEADAALLDTCATIKTRRFCHECLHPIPSSRERDDTHQGRGGTRSQLLEDPDEINCMRCRRHDGDEHMILCDGCDSGYHTFCLDPPLKSIPEGDWLCPHCVPNYVAPRLTRPLAIPADGITDTESATEHRIRCPLSAADQKEIELVVLQLTTTVQRAAWRESLSIGDTCACIDVNRVWYEARVVGVRGGGMPEQYAGNATPGRYLVPHSIDTVARRRGSSRQLLIHFAGWHRQWDEWVSCFSDRIQPAGTQCLKQSHSTTQPQVSNGSTPGVSRSARGLFAAGRLAEVLNKQRCERTPVFEPEGLALEAELIAEEQWVEYRRHLCVHAQVEAVVGVLVRTVEQNHRDEQRLQMADNAVSVAQALQAQRAAEMKRRQTKREEQQRMKLEAAQKRQEQKISRLVASALKRLVDQVAAHARNETIVTQRVAREQERARKRLLDAARRQAQQQRQQEAAILRTVRSVLIDAVAEVEKRARQEAEVFGVLHSLVQQVEKTLVKQPTLAFALSSGWLRVGQWLDVLWQEEQQAEGPRAQLNDAAATSGPPQWYTAKILGLPPLPVLRSSEWHCAVTLSYPVSDTEYQEENLHSWEEIKHIECRLKTDTVNNSFGEVKKKRRKRTMMDVEQSSAECNQHVVQPCESPSKMDSAGELVTITATAHLLLLDELRVLRRRYETMQAELHVRCATSFNHGPLLFLIVPTTA
jgi:hypothetical protein